MKVSFGSTKKELKIASIAVILIVVITTVWIISQTNSTRLVLTPEIQKCAEEKLSSYKETAPGQISVKFVTNISEEEARKTIEKYGIGVTDTVHNRLDNSYFLYLTVPNGLEFEWMCELEKNDMVEYAKNTLIISGGPAPYE